MAISLICSALSADGCRLGNCLWGVARGEGEVSESKRPSLGGVVEREGGRGGGVGEGEEKGTPGCSCSISTTSRESSEARGVE